MAEADVREALISIRKNARPPPPLVLGENKVEEWKTFKSRWDNYVLLSSIDKVPNELQLAQLQNCLGDDALKMLSGFKFDTAERDRTVKEVLDEFERFVIGQVNETLERYKFGKRAQMEGENLSKYVANLRRMMKTCGYCNNCEPTMLRDRIVLGIRDDDVREDLLKDSKLTLEKCVDICMAGEAASQHKYSLSNDKVHSVMKSTKRTGKKGKCRYCAQEHPFRKEECPAWGKRCSGCRKKNHFEVCCKNKSDYDSAVQRDDPKEKRKVRLVQEAGPHHEPEDSSEEEWVNSVATPEGTREVKCEMLVDKETVVFQMDTGATCNLLPHRYAKDIQRYNGTLKMWNSTSTQPLGKCRQRVINPKNKGKYNVEFIVCEDECPPILGLSACQQMGLVKIQENAFHRVASLTTEAFGDVFDDNLGTLPGAQSLRVKHGSHPVTMANRRVSVNMREKLREELSRLEKLQVIERVTEPTPWLSQLVMTPKKDGSVRVCIDPFELNKVLQREQYTIPILEDVLHEMRDAKVFTKADLSSGYWHVVLDDEASKMTAFQTPFGRYKWKRLPFGLSVSAEIFQ